MQEAQIGLQARLAGNKCKTLFKKFLKSKRAEG
jgi:hypothetical protein